MKNRTFTAALHGLIALGLLVGPIQLFGSAPSSAFSDSQRMDVVLADCDDDQSGVAASIDPCLDLPALPVERLALELAPETLSASPALLPRVNDGREVSIRGPPALS